MKKFFFLIGILAVLFIGGYFVLTSYAVKFIQPHLQKVMGPGFTLEKTKLRTTYLSATGIRYEDPDSKQRFLQIEEIRVYPSLLSLLKRSLYVKELTILQPSFFFYRSRGGGHGRSMDDDEKGGGRGRGFSGEGEEERRAHSSSDRSDSNPERLHRF